MSPVHSFSQSEYDRCDGPAKKAGAALLKVLLEEFQIDVRETPRRNKDIDLRVFEAQTRELIIEVDVAVTQVWARWPMTIWKHKDRYWLRDPSNHMIVFNTTLDEALVIVGVDILKSEVIVEPRRNPLTKKMEPTELRAVEQKHCRLWKKNNGAWSEA
jgi:hypothetical protein